MGNFDRWNVTSTAGVSSMLAKLLGIGWFLLIDWNPFLTFGVAGAVLGIVGAEAIVWQLRHQAYMQTYMTCTGGTVVSRHAVFLVIWGVVSVSLMVANPVGTLQSIGFVVEVVLTVYLFWSVYRKQ